MGSPSDDRYGRLGDDRSVNGVGSRHFEQAVGVAIQVGGEEHSHERLHERGEVV